MPTPPALSVLDQTPVPDGFTAAEAVAHTLALARATDRLGYRRYWLAEHHDTPSLAGTAPEILVSAVAAATAAMRVGSGGVLLPYYSPLKVAEVFRMLHTLHPGRIDLGVGRAAGTDPAAEAALLASGGASGEEHFAEHVAELVGFLHDDFDPAHPWAAVRAMPDGPGAPALWLLGSSSHSTSIAAALKLSFAFAHFITPDFGPRLMASYRRRLRIPAREDVPDAGERSRPRAAVAVSVLCADTDAAARAQASTTDRWRLGPEGSTRPPILPPDAVAAAPWTELERLRAAQSRAKTFVGTPEQVRPRLEALAAEFEVDELIVLTVCHDPAARLRSYQLLAEAFGLTAPPRP